LGWQEGWGLIIQFFQRFDDLGDIMEYRARGEEDTALGIFREEGDVAILGDGEGDPVGTM
jgi:hypothetical protein